MSQEQQLRFSVEESVWFQKGQEVSELLSISLDPDISIHEHDQYISIRGALLLTGEYKIDQDGSEGDSFEYANVRYVNEVETREDGISELSHRFPVDITIPRNRISQLDDVYVSIESFDYELPELKCLKLIADLSISGISDSEAVQNEEVETTREEELEPLYRESQDETEVNGEESFAQAERTAVSPFSSFYEVNESDDSDMDKLSPPSITIHKEVTESREESEEEIFTEISSQDLSVQVEEQEETEQQEVLNSEPIQDEEKEQEDLYDPFSVEVRKEEQNEEPQEVQYSFFSKSEAEVEKVEELDEQDERDEKDQKDAHYLTSLFARDDEEDFSRLKMCIVQQGDTLNSICDRYEISIQQIVRVNDFQADQDVYEGQILYIPAYSTSK
ncbi:stage VI sporulation protein D [Metabacillus halosaccharovorans]|uniref:Stage VI sporulation protein D n=1 Tax=Metabacillus halosaccharovorans TaxID=930124 RepID=A0ABT3DDR1_9BACI|nr:stage VI sporulation protein D [Metabacillus halosaccharovorans]MCV9885210.1 stage VI sporulation protein D [Metabacillus halosaccharovorans]